MTDNQNKNVYTRNTFKPFFALYLIIIAQRGTAFVRLK